MIIYVVMAAIQANMKTYIHVVRIFLNQLCTGHTLRPQPRGNGGEFDLCPADHC